MSLIKFNQDITLAFISADHIEVERKSFIAGEFAEFTVQEDSTGFTLTSADGSYAPWVGREVFSILPEGFQLYRFMRDVSLYFGIYEHGQWIYDIGSRLYPKDSIHAFKISHDLPAEDDFLHLQTPNGNILPEIHETLIENIGSSVALAISRSTDKKGKTEPKQVLEAFPAPVPGTQFGNTWGLPDYFNSLRVVRDAEVRGSLLNCSDTPVAYLRLVEGDGRRYDRLYYRCSFFGVPRRKVAKV